MIIPKMTHISNYNLFLFESAMEDIELVEIITDANILESIITDSESLLKTIDATEVDLSEIFGVSATHENIESLYNDQVFSKSLTDKGYSKSKIEYSKDYDTFLERTLDIKFFSIYETKRTNLDPTYLVFQHKVKQEVKWSPVKMYKIGSDMRKFYDQLTTKTIELKRAGANYIYITSNSGADWVLKNVESANDVFKKLLSNDDVKVILKDGQTSITIIA